MSDLTRFRDHCREMATAEHKPECQWYDPQEVVRHNVRQSAFERMFDEAAGTRLRVELCTGCVSESDRALFGLLAAEVDDYLTPQVDLFGDVTSEPTLEDA